MSGRARRMFFAAWPDASWCAALQEQVAPTLRAATRLGRAVPVADWHATLCFLGSIEPDPLAWLREQAASIDVARFVLQLDRIEYWSAAGLLCLAGRGPPGPAVELVERLRRLARTAGLGPDERAFLPHLTLARRLPPMRRGSEVAAGLGLREIEPLPWTVERFCLAESRGQAPAGSAVRTARYQIVESWPLRAVSSER